jgi:hypothetical protein
VSLYLQVRQVRILTAAVLVTIVGIVTPIAVLPVTAGPLGATMAIGLALALIVPVAAAWACGRGYAELESVGVQNVGALDLALVIVAVSVTAASAASAELVGASDIGLVASRASLTFGGILLAERWRNGWETAATVPTLYLLAVAVAGRGGDLAHPAAWAWIAADRRDAIAWAATLVVFGLGLLLAARRLATSR